LALGWPSAAWGAPSTKHRLPFFLGVILLFAASVRTHLLPYGLMELICFGLIGVWLWLFEARLRGLMTDL
jgi:hypothetical protein